MQLTLSWSCGFIPLVGETQYDFGQLKGKYLNYFRVSMVALSPNQGSGSGLLEFESELKQTFGCQDRIYNFGRLWISKVFYFLPRIKGRALKAIPIKII